MLFIAGDRAWETLLNGQPAFITKLDYDLRIHHEVFPLDTGNLLSIVHDYQDVEVEVSPGVFETQHWKGDRIVEINRQNNNVVWEWKTNDHYSTLDFDETVMQIPAISADEPPGGSYPHTHVNAAVYDSLEDHVYLSSRHLSRVTRIKRSNGDIVYNMGFTMPSGDTDFGDDLFSWQHSPEIQPDGNMLLYDNGNRRGHVDRDESDGITKVIELTFSGSPSKPNNASIVWEWTVPDYQRALGDSDRLANGNTLVVAGVTGQIYEVSAAGDIVWQVELPVGSPDHLIYRAERIPYLVSGTAPLDTDGDEVADLLDNCPDHINAGQGDRDGDGFGDTCARALGVGVFALPSLSPVGFGLLILALVGLALVVPKTERSRPVG
jgi:hypothetical protein